MNATPEKFSAAHKAAVESSLNIVKTVFDSAERLVVLNLNTARSLFEDSSANLKALLAVKTPEEFFSLQTSFAQPAAAKAVAYYRNSYEIVAQSIEEIAKPFEAQMIETNKLVAAELEKAAKSAPVGSEAALAAVKSTIAAANSTYDQVTKATRQVAEMAEANMAAATDVAVKAVSVPAPAKARKSA